MKSIKERVSHPVSNVSFEFFPPKSEVDEARLWETVEQLQPYNPRFVSVTYGAGGSTRERTHKTVKRLAEKTSLTPAAHLTCVGASKAETLDIIQAYYQAGVRHIVALRGDPETGMGGQFSAHEEGFASSVELIRSIRETRPELGKCFEISVSCYPEAHPDSQGASADIAWLKQKAEAGADRAISQFFFEPEVFLRYRDKLADAGITLPIVPGIMLQANFKSLLRISKLCGTKVPDWMHKVYDGLDADPTTRELLTATIAAELCFALEAEGVKDFHFYTLNRANLAVATCRLLGITPHASTTS